MKIMGIEQFISKLEAEISDLPKGILKPESKFSDYPDLWDSLNIVLLIAFAKTEFDADIETEDIVKAKTIKDLYNTLLIKAKE